MVLAREAKVVVAAEAAVDAAETNWKHKVTPNQGDLMILRFQYTMINVCHKPDNLTIVLTTNSDS